MQIGPDARERLVPLCFGLCGQQGIEKSCLRTGKVNVSVLGRTHSGQGTDPAQPFLRQHSVGSVIELHHVVAATQGREQFWQSRLGVAVIHFAVQFEPVHTAGHFEPVGSRPAEDFSFGVNVPSRLDQRPHDPWQLTRRKPAGRFGFPVTRLASFHAQLIEQCISRCFGVEIAPQKPPAVSLKHAPRAIELRHNPIVVGKRELRLQAPWS